MKTYAVEKVKIEYNNEKLYNGKTCDMPYLDNLAENLALEFYEDKDEEIPEEELEAKVEEILVELEDNIEYYEEEEIDGDYYIEQEYWTSVL